jgi:hypothetical protein
MTTLNHTKDDIVFQIIDFHTENYDKREHQDEDDAKHRYDDDSDVEYDYDSDDDRYVRVTNNSSSDEDEKDEDKTSKYTIYVYGKDKQDLTYCIEITDFTPYFYIRLPDYATNDHRQLIEQWIKTQLKPQFRDGFSRSSLLDKYSFRNFDNKKKWRFMRLVFNNTTSMRAAISLFQDKKYDSKESKYQVYPKQITISGVTRTPFTYDIYENMIDPLLKFLHHRKLKPVGWAKIKRGDYKIREHSPSSCNYDLTVRWNDIHPVEDVNNSRIKIMAYDIECDSSHGDFPLPKKDYIKFAREIFTWFMKINKMKQQSEESSEDYEYYHNLIKNKEHFVTWCINKCYYHYNKNNDTYGYSTELDELKVRDAESYLH